MSRLALFAIAGLLVVLTACAGGNEGNEGTEPAALHERIMNALSTEQVSHLRYTFQESPEKPVEQHELWIDWENELARHTRVVPGLPFSVTVIADGTIHESRRPPQPLDKAGFEQSFDEAAIPSTHLFQWLTLPDGQFREPLRRLTADGDGVERFGWTIESRNDDSGFCGLITLELDADRSFPLRSYADPCPELGDASGSGFVTEYELIEVLPRSALPPSTFEPSSLLAAPTMVSVIDWVSFIQFGGIQYLRASPPSAIDDEDLGPEFARVGFNVSENVTDPFYKVKDGDAAFLDPGTPVYEVRGYAPTFRLAARQDSRLLLYQVVSNPLATTGDELLDIGGKVDYIGVIGVDDGRELARIDDADEVAALVDLVLAAPVDQDSRDQEGRRYSIAFHLTDGTRVTRFFWPESGELRPGIMLPPAFATAVERALRGDQ